MSIALSRILGYNPYMDTKTITRPSRRNRILVEDVKHYTYRLPISLVEAFQRVAERERVSYSGAIEEAISLFLEKRIRIGDTENGQSDD